MKCESCAINKIEVEELATDEHSPYRLCQACYQRLLNYSLRPLEFFNLASIHGHSYYLHDDFYDYNTGEATQPRTKVVNAESFPFPDLARIQNDIKKLVDYACVQHFTSTNVIQLLELHDKDAILNYLDEKVKYNRAINYKAYEVAAKILSSTASEWIIKEWKNRKENEILIFAEAICKCLPFDEAFQILTTEIEESSDKDFTNNSSALLYFQSPMTLNWIEKVSNRILNVSSSWGTLAAASQFSWERAANWLTMGRPLSLIALDALIFCTATGDRRRQAHWLIEHPLILADEPKPAVIANAITSYLAKDKAPRTRNAVEQIIQNLFETGD